MDKRKILMLILLITGAVLVCGCDKPTGASTLVNCNYNAATDKWDCYMVYTTYWNDEKDGIHMTDKYSTYSTDYCSPLDGPYIVRTCEGKEYAPPSPSPSPSPSPTYNGPTYKITELKACNSCGGGGGGGGTFP